MKAGHGRDRTLDMALKHALGSHAEVPASEACLDAETLAAWMDDGLDPAAVALSEAHVSSCARCQGLVGAMARSAPEVAASGHAFRSLWRWWLAPVAAAAAATIVWMVVPDQRYAAPPTAPVEDVAQAPTAGFVTEPQPPANLSAPPAPFVAPRPSQDALRREVAADALERPAAPAQSAAERVDLTAARDVASPDPAVRWRIGANGIVDYTVDGGRRWERTTTGVTTEIVAGSSPSPAVCWLVGHGGLVLVSADGRTFARVSAPVDADLAGVQASDARTAVVTAADGRAFVTEDQGLTWRPRE